MNNDGCWVMTGQRSNGKTTMLQIIQRVMKRQEEEFKANNPGREYYAKIETDIEQNVDLDDVD
jgi:hypothetical protein